MFIVLLAITMTTLRWFNTTATTKATTMAFATSNYSNSEIINALMMESLRSNFVQACDSERITLHCPKNTQILLENTFYGRLVSNNELCPSHNQFPISEHINCDVIQAHMKILEQCRNKRKCKIMVRPSFFGTDPCPDTSKYLQISYKCKPVSFDEELFCEGSTMQLSCKQNRRLVIYSAHYGRAVEGRAMHCTSNASIAQDCMINVLDQVLYNCHARTECTALVNDEQFGKTGCGPGIHKYLTVIFMCMNDEIFSEAAVKGNLEAMNKIISHLSPMKIPEVKTTLVKDDELNFHIKDDPNLGYETMQKILSLSEMNQNVNSYEESEDDGAFVIANPIDVTTPSGLPFNVFGFIHDVLVIVQIIKDNKEKVLLCLFLSLLAGLTMLLITCTISGYYRYRRKRKNSKMKSSEESSQAAKPTELNTLMESNHSPSVFLDSNNRICFDIGDLSNNSGTFLRFTQLTPPRVPQNIHGYS